MKRNILALAVAFLGATQALAITVETCTVAGSSDLWAVIDSGDDILLETNLSQGTSSRHWIDDNAQTICSLATAQPVWVVSAVCGSSSAPVVEIDPGDDNIYQLLLDYTVDFDLKKINTFYIDDNPKMLCL